MDMLRNFWSRFDRNHLRVFAGALLLIATPILWLNRIGTTWSKIGFGILLMELIVLMFGVFRKQDSEH
jgi:hypothetical protein